MELLDFSLPEFTRLSWVSDHARAVWEPRLQRIAQAWVEVERRTVPAGIRRCSVTTVTAAEFATRAEQWDREGLRAVPTEVPAARNGAERTQKGSCRPVQAALMRIVLGTTQDVADFQAALEANDHQALAALLGCPACCHERYRALWVQEGLTDMVWSSAAATAPPVDGARSIEISGPPQTNILWRTLGACALSHPPCHCHCGASIALADQCLALGRQAGYGAEIDWLLEILHWPAEWSALHGIAEIKTPVLKISTRTDATACKYVVRRQGDAYPDEGIQGLNFPYQVPRAPRLTQSRGFRRGLENPIAVLDGQPAEGPSRLIALPLCVG